MLSKRILAAFLALVLGSATAAIAGEPVRPLETRARSATTRPASLRAAAEARGLLVGAAVFPEGLGDARYAETLAREFNFITPENVTKWQLIQPRPDQWNFGPADALVAFAEKHGMKVKGHCLIWHSQLPAYVHAGMTPEELRAAVRDHILGEVGHYKGRVYAWDVVNEAVDDSQVVRKVPLLNALGTRATGGEQGLRKTLFLDKLGEGYIAEAFRLAHEADPNALLIYNDYMAEGLGGKSDRVYELVKKLKADGVPIGGVGLQMHISAEGYPKPADIAANVRRLAALGLKVNISEMDVQIKKLNGTLPERLAVQRKVYHDVIAACLGEKSFMAVTFWGFTDAHSWIDQFFGPDDPLLFDENYRPKPAYEGALEALAGK